MQYFLVSLGCFAFMNLVVWAMVRVQALVGEWFPRGYSWGLSLGLPESVVQAGMAGLLLLPLLWVGNLLYAYGYTLAAAAGLSFAFTALVVVLLTTLTFPLLELLTGTPLQLGTLVSILGIALSLLIGYYVNQHGASTL
ncbi:hypothetical protein H6771_00605 [Candidatus Peribacteria bacterium]|nr:hypothetical protein [Candidatus Peribacteria bacterium]